MHAHLSAALLAASLASGTFAQPNTWTVDDSGGADFVEIAAAVEAASDGDRIVVVAGSYFDGVTIDGKGLTLIAVGNVVFSGSGPFGLEVSLLIENLSETQTVSMRGFHVLGSADYDGDAIDLKNNEGAIVFEDCELGSGTVGFQVSRGRPLRAVNCASVTLRNCLIEAPDGYVSWIPGQVFDVISYSALAAFDSNLFLYDSDFFGGTGSPSDGFTIISEDHPASGGGNGVWMRGGSLLASGCSFVGGNAGQVHFSDCYNGQDGGSGLVVTTSLFGNGSVQLIDCAYSSGAGSTGACGAGGGVTPAAIVDKPGVLELLPGSARTFDVDSPVFEAQSTTVRMTGEFGDAVTLFYSTGFTAAERFDTLGVAAHLSAPLSLLPLGSLPASGQLDLTVHLPSLPASLDSFLFTGQAIFLDGFAVYDGGPGSLAVLSDAL